MKKKGRGVAKFYLCWRPSITTPQKWGDTAAQGMQVKHLYIYGTTYQPHPQRQGLGKLYVKTRIGLGKKEEIRRVSTRFNHVVRGGECNFIERKSEEYRYIYLVCQLHSVLFE